MCLSAEASFGVGAALMACGAYCVQAAYRKNKDYIPLASVPLFFGIQQFCEGAVWLGAARSGSLGFLFFAIALWPVWLPLSMYSISKSLIALLFAQLGMIWGLMLYLPIVAHPELLNVSVVNHSIQYEFISSDLLRLLYLLNVVVPVYFCKDRMIWALGVVAIISAVISHLFLSYAFVSLWCFFAAVISMTLCYLFYKMENNYDKC